MQFLTEYACKFNIYAKDMLVYDQETYVALFTIRNAQNIPKKTQLPFKSFHLFVLYLFVQIVFN